MLHHLGRLSRGPSLLPRLPRVHPTGCTRPFSSLPFRASSLLALTPPSPASTSLLAFKSSRRFVSFKSRRRPTTTQEESNEETRREELARQEAKATNETSQASETNQFIKEGSQGASLDEGASAFVRRVYTILAGSIGVCGAAAMMAIGSGVMVSPLVAGLAALVPLLGIYFTNPRDHSPQLRGGLLAAFAGLSGLSIAPILAMSLAINPLLIPTALLGTAGIFLGATAFSLMSPKGSMLRWGGALFGGMLMLLLLGLASFFVPVTSALYPILHSISLYGGLALFSVYIAYDTQRMLDDYENGQDDAVSAAVNLFIDIKAIFVRLLIILMNRD